MAGSNRRSTPLIVIGVIVFILGTGLLVALFGGDDGGDDGAARTPVTAAPAPPAPGAVTAPGGAPGFTIPEGRQAVAVQVPFVPGVAGYLKAGDVVNVYGTFNERQVNPRLPTPQTKLVVANMSVLAATTPAPGADTGNVTIVLAATADEAEQLIYLQSYEGLYVTLVPAGQPPAVTGGRSPGNIL